MPVINIHACAISIDNKTVLIQGASGAGKTSLMLHLYRRCHAANIDVAIITDDQTLLEKRQNSLIATAPKAIEGLVEIRGYGIVPCTRSTHRDGAVAWLVTLCPQQRAKRLWDGDTVDLVDVQINNLMLAENSPESAANAIFAALNLPLYV